MKKKLVLFVVDCFVMVVFYLVSIWFKYMCMIICLILIVLIFRWFDYIKLWFYVVK